jgi:hypothetical protein
MATRRAARKRRAARRRPTKTPRQEERDAKQQERQLERARAAAADKREKEARTKLGNIIREEMALPRWKQCRCGITLRTTRAEINAMGAGCTAGRWVCPTLDAIRRKLER